MKVINTESCTVVIDKAKNRVIKIFKPYWTKKCPWMIKNEVRALERLKESKHFPNLISHDDNSITMEYAGSVLTSTKYVKNPFDNYDVRDFEHIPKDFEEQIEAILNDLIKANLRHSDINAQHFLIKDGWVKLIDFELCLEIGEQEPKGYPQTQGIESRTRNLDEPIDDKLMAHRAVKNLFGEGLHKVFRALGKLPNRNQYHELPFKIPQKVNRLGLAQRIEILESAYDFNHAIIKNGKRVLKGKKGIDLGCNLGGIAFSLAMKGAKMTGVDLIPEFIEVANACEEYYKLGCKFVQSEISDYVLNTRNFLTEHYDFCIFLATWHWVVNQKGEDIGIKVLNRISKCCDVMFFETNYGHEEGLVGTEEMMKEIGITDDKKLIDFIIKHTDYTKVEKIGTCVGWNNRPTFICKK